MCGRRSDRDTRQTKYPLSPSSSGITPSSIGGSSGLTFNAQTRRNCVAKCSMFEMGRNSVATSDPLRLSDRMPYINVPPSELANELMASAIARLSVLLRSGVPGCSLSLNSRVKPSEASESLRALISPRAVKELDNGYVSPRLSASLRAAIILSSASHPSRISLIVRSGPSSLVR